MRRVNQYHKKESNWLENPFLVVFAMKIPLDYPSAVFPRVFADVECLSAEGEDDVFVAVRANFLQSELLIPLVVQGLLHDNCPVLVRVVGDCKKLSRLPALQHDFELAVNEGELLVVSSVAIVDDKLAMIWLVLAEIEDSACR